MSSRWNTRPLSHGSSSTLHSESGVCEDASTWSGNAGCFGMVTRWDVFGSYGVLQAAQIPGQWVCQSCGMGGCWPTRQSCYRCGAPRLGGNIGHLKRESHYPGQPSNQGLPINSMKRVLRGFKGGNGQSPPNVVPTFPVPASNQGLADPAMLLPLVQSLGLPVEVLEGVRARVATQKTPKKVSREKTAFVAPSQD